MRENTDEWRLRRQRLALAAVGQIEPLSPAQRRTLAALLCLEGRRWQVLLVAAGRNGPVLVVLVAMVGVFVIAVEPTPGRRSAAAAGAGVADPAEAALLALTANVAAILTRHGVSPAVVQPVLVVGEPATPGVRASHLTERQLVPALRARAVRRLRVGEAELADTLLASLPGARRLLVGSPPAGVDPGGGQAQRRLSAAGVSGARPGRPAVVAPLIDLDALRSAQLAAARARPIEEWLTFLDPSQLALVTRGYSGPARISGPAGTGKTVVALHRLAYLSRRHAGRLLYVTYARNLPVVQAAAFRRLAPDVARRVEFDNVHAWARSLLAARGRPRHVDRRAVRSAFHLAWTHAGAGGRLERLEPDPEYWREEVDHVIKGRGLICFEQYRDVSRARRRMALAASARLAVWRLYEEYQRRLRDRRAVDHNDVLAAALAEVRSRPPSPGYDVVVVDEVQDLPLLALWLLHALVGDRPDGLLLVGDGQQAIYPGGYRLSEVGIPLRGRVELLRVNYRNAAAVLREACAVEAPDDYDDAAWFVGGDQAAGGPAAGEVPANAAAPAVSPGHTPEGHAPEAATQARPTRGRVGQPVAPAWWLGRWRPAEAGPAPGGWRLRDVRVACPGGRRVHCRASSEAEHDAALVAAIASSGAAPGETAVITETHAQARHYRRVLRAAGIAVMDLADYTGTPSPQVKVGTVHRAKGLEFAAVLLPYLPLALGAEPPGLGLPPCDADLPIPRGWRDNAPRHRLVAITRARDFVWLGHLAAAG